MGADFLVGRKLPTSFLPDEDYGFLFLSVQLPPAASLERTDKVTRKIEAILANTPGVQTYTTIDGFSLLTRVSTTNNAFYFVNLKPWAETDIFQSRGQGHHGEYQSSIVRAGAGSDRVCLQSARHSRLRQRRGIFVLAARPQRRLGGRS